MPNRTPLYALRFDPIFQYRLWGGRRLADIVSAPLPDGPVGEAWILSDRDDHPSLVANGPLKGQTIAQILEASPLELLGRYAEQFRRFPLLLKFLDAREMLSVQVHPTDQETEFLPPGESGKTEAWVVLQAEPESRIYAGLRPGTTKQDLRTLTAKTADDHLAYFHPVIGQGVLLEAGTVHALGGGVVVFEVQQNSDVTFRLFDWDRVDPKTGKPRDLTIDEAIACTNFKQGAIHPAEPTLEEARPVRRERMFESEHFWLNRCRGESPFPVGASGVPRVVVCIEGVGQIADAESGPNPIRKGDVFLLPASVGECSCRPITAVTLLEIGLPGDPA